MSKIHFTRNREHVMCNPRLDTVGRPVLSDAKLLKTFTSAEVCQNCFRMLSPREQTLATHPTPLWRNQENPRNFQQISAPARTLDSLAHTSSDEGTESES